MGKYYMLCGEDDILGEGASSICRKGLTKDGTAVAIKVYKKGRRQSVSDKKFVRQIAVLEEFRRPLLQRPDDESLWCDELAHSACKNVFLQLIDYSKNEDGSPGPDPIDGETYVVTEVASYSLEQYINMRRNQRRSLSVESVRSIARSIILVTAALHSQGYVHLDLKPENLMLFDGCLKLIDVDGCVKIGSTISIDDSSLSFSPVYCSPEWAGFLISEADHPTIYAHPNLDVWSIGMTLAELVTLSPVFKTNYTNFVRYERSVQDASFLFLEWLHSLKAFPVPKKLDEFQDQEFVDLLTQHLLVPKPQDRRGLASVLSHPFVRVAELKKAKTGPIKMMADSPTGADRRGSDDEGPLPELLPVAASPKKTRSLGCANEIAHQGLLWKLAQGGDANRAEDWQLLDMWISTAGALSYITATDRKRRELIDGHHMISSLVEECKTSARKPAFVLEVRHDDGDEDSKTDQYTFAAESDGEYDRWLSVIREIQSSSLFSQHLGAEFRMQVKKFHIAVRNRRLMVKEGKDQTPVFRARLWKAKANGDIMKESDWFERDMWLSENATLVYYSPKEQKELVYYTAEDLMHCTVTEIDSQESFRPWAFLLRVQDTGDVTFEPGAFAAESEEMRTRWVEAIRRLSA